jgi:hypothetical protein
MAENQGAQDGSVVNYKRPIKPYKVAFTGAYNVGKTSLFRRIFKEDFSNEKTPSFVDKRTHEEIFYKHETVIPVRISRHENRSRNLDNYNLIRRRYTFKFFLYSNLCLGHVNCQIGPLHLILFTDPTHTQNNVATYRGQFTATRAPNPNLRGAKNQDCKELHWRREYFHMEFTLSMSLWLYIHRASFSCCDML